MLIAELAEFGHDLFELVEALEDEVAALLGLLEELVGGGDSFAERAAVLNDVSFFVAESHLDAAVDEAALLGGVVHFGVALAGAGGGDLVGVGAVLF